uniref:Uncharacterized protein n=1 Tax=Daphnia magna TaxID=35525 RepID=A0A0P4Z070_9CRUS
MESCLVKPPHDVFDLSALHLHKVRARSTPLTTPLIKCENANKDQTKETRRCKKRQKITSDNKKRKLKNKNRKKGRKQNSNGLTVEIER